MGLGANVQFQGERKPKRTLLGCDGDWYVERKGEELEREKVNGIRV